MLMLTLQVPVLILVEHSGEHEMVPEAQTADFMDLTKLREMQNLHVNVCNVRTDSFDGVCEAVDWLDLAMHAHCQHS